MPSSPGWFAGPKAGNGEWFAKTIRSILEDHYYWRRNYFPEDAIVVDSEARRRAEPFRDELHDKLNELLARLKADFPFHSPRYAAHMVSEQSLPAIAGYFAAMLYNPNNVSTEAAPVTVQLEIEAAQMISCMLGYGEHSWAHLTSGGTVANFEALWIARTVRYLPLVVRDMRAALGLPARETFDPLGVPPASALEAFAQVFEEADLPAEDVITAYRETDSNVVERGLGAVLEQLGSDPVLIAPETQHYSIKKALDLLGLGRRSLVTIKVDSDFRMNVDDLRSRLEEIDRAGGHVVAVLPIVGTTEEGAIDPVDRIVELRREREDAGLPSFWIHADAAYGGYLRTVTLPTRLGLGEPDDEVIVRGERRRIPLHLPVGASCDALEALGECDSITIDPHKLGYVPYPAGAVCFKSDIVKPLARQDAPYIEESASSVEEERNSKSIGVYVLEGSKPGAAAAAVWLSHRLIPLDKSGHGLLMQENIRNAAELHALLGHLAETSDVRAEALCPPGSNILCFAFRSRGARSLKELNELNERIYEQFSLSEGHHISDREFFLSRTRLRPQQYSITTVEAFLARLGVGPGEYEEEGVFLLRSVLMNPWYKEAKQRGRFYLTELAAHLYEVAAGLFSER